MPRPAYTSDENEEIRQRLADGALVLFREEGLENLTLRKLAARMDVSHTKLYRYFENKDALLSTVRIASLQIYYDLLRNNDPVNSGPMARLRQAGLSLQEFAAKYPLDYQFLFASDQPSDDPELLSLRHDVFDYVVSIAEMAIGPEHPYKDARTFANLAWAMLHGLISLNYRNQLIEGRSFEQLMGSALDHLFAEPEA